MHPGPAFSVMDVARGWTRGLQSCGVDVLNVELEKALWFFNQSHILDDEGLFRKALDTETEWLLTSELIRSHAFTWWPDVVFVVSGFFVTPRTVELFHARNMKVVWIFTESPYEDDNQLARAGAGSDLCILNDPTNIDAYRAAGIETLYVPHSYDPLVHRPGPVNQWYQSEVCIVGTGFRSRVEFLERMSWDDIDLALLGNWKALNDRPTLQQYVRLAVDDENDADRYQNCIDNTETVRWYQSTEASLNLYRREANRPELVAGYAMGPREVELAACGTFFLTEPRGENETVLPFVPKLSTPEEASEQLRWWLAHEDARHEVSRKARQAVDGWTFDKRAGEVLRLLDRQPVSV